MASNASLLGASMLLVILLAAYGYVSLSSVGTPAAQMAAVANPAATHCIDVGGTLEIRESTAGEAGYCVFADGRICEEWALFRDGECIQP